MGNVCPARRGSPRTHSPRTLWHLRTSLRKVASGVTRAGAADTHSRKPHIKKASEGTGSDTWGSLSQFSLIRSSPTFLRLATKRVLPWAEWWPPYPHSGNPRYFPPGPYYTLTASWPWVPCDATVHVFPRNKGL